MKQLTKTCFRKMGVAFLGSTIPRFLFSFPPAHVILSRLSVSLVSEVSEQISPIEFV